VKKFSLLEELDISFYEKISMKKTLEDIGRCCPLLKSLNLAYKFDLYGYFAKHLFPIAKTMHGLCRLSFSTIVVSDDELLAILNGCPLLDSLHLKRCVCDRRLSPSLVKRCHEQIKDLQLPTLSLDDSDDDYDNSLAYMDTFEDTYANEYWEY
jgi:F-box/leucine-rich repeat protein 2/20